MFMYNRYIPQSDGSYKRSRVVHPEPHVPRPPAPQPVENPRPATPTRQSVCRSKPQRTETTSRHRDPIEGNLFSFLRNLFPSGFDTGDLFVILLLLLMSGDCTEDQNTALLTLALYLFL